MVLNGPELVGIARKSKNINCRSGAEEIETPAFRPAALDELKIENAAAEFSCKSFFLAGHKSSHEAELCFLFGRVAIYIALLRSFALISGQGGGRSK